MKAKKASAPRSKAKVVTKARPSAPSAKTKAKAAKTVKAAKGESAASKKAKAPAKPKAAVIAKKAAKSQEPKTTKPAKATKSAVKPAKISKAPKVAEPVFSSKTPRQEHFRMPAEWETHYGTWLTWPNRKGISFPGKGAYEAALPALEAMVSALIASEQVFINVGNEEDKQLLKDTLTLAEQRHVHFLDGPVMEPWCRDHGATLLVRDKDRHGAAVIWKFNGWGGKYEKLGDDTKIALRMAEYLGGKLFNPGIVLEGGAIDVNGSGSVLVTESCLLNKNRNRGMKKEAMEQILKDYLHVKNVLWLPGGLEGDDTDGHIDTIARFVSRTSVVTVVEDNPKDKNYAILQKNLELLQAMKAEDGTPLEVIPLPMPKPIVRKGQRLPATYANFYIGNKIVLLPTFDDPADEKALEIMVKCFPSRRIYPIDSRELIWGLGSFHCLTQQLPLAAFPKVIELIRNPPPTPKVVY